MPPVDFEAGKTRFKVSYATLKTGNLPNVVGNDAGHALTAG